MTSYNLNQNEIPVGTVDGSNQIFNLSNTPVRQNSVELTVDLSESTTVVDE